MADPNTDVPNSGDAPALPGLAVEVDRTGPCTANVRVTVDGNELRTMRDRGIRNLSRGARYKGFRPGKAPQHLIEKDFGPRVDAELKQVIINQAFEQAIQQEDLKPAAAPRIAEDKVRIERDADFSHEFEVWLRPEFELGEYQGLEIEGAPTEVTEDEVDATIEDLKRRESRPEPAGEEGLEAEGVASCKVEFLVPEEEEPILDHEGIRMSPKTPLNGVDSTAFEGAMTGAKEGEVREVEINFPDDFPVDSARGRGGIVRLTMSEVFRIIPPTDEEFRRMLGAESDEEMKEKLTERMIEAKGDQERQRIEMALIDQLIQMHPMDLPEKMVELQTEAKVGEMRETLAKLDLEEAQLQERLDAERDRAWEQTDRAMRAVYILEEIAKAESIEITQEDLVSELQEIATRNGTEVDEVRKYYQEQGLFQQLGLELLERKVRSFLRESADIKVPG